jgi:hypothetical protein
MIETLLIKNNPLTGSANSTIYFPHQRISLRYDYDFSPHTFLTTKIKPPSANRSFPATQTAQAKHEPPAVAANN